MHVLTVNLVLVGFGNVGRRFVQLLQERTELLAQDHGLAARIVAIATRRHGAARSEEGIDVAAALRVVEHGGSLDSLGAVPLPRGETPAVSGAIAAIASCAGLAAAAPTVMIETSTLDVERGEPAASHILAAFEAGMHVITANKGPIACCYRKLHDEAARRHRHFFFEGTVMDGIPVFNLVRETMPAVRVTGFRGVVNVTTNYILAGMEEGRTFEEALGEMQRAGIAEADATLDVDGWDAAAKACALANVLMNADLVPARVERTGIRDLTAGTVRSAREGGRRIKLVAAARMADGRVHARVAPEALPSDDRLATLSGMASAIELDTDLLDKVTVIEGLGGLTQTAYALLSDLVAIRRRLHAPLQSVVRRNL